RRHTRFSRDWSSDVCSSDLRTSSTRLFLALFSSESFATKGFSAPKPFAVTRDLSIPLAIRSFITAFARSFDNFLLYDASPVLSRSEERRVGKECGSRYSQTR